MVSRFRSLALALATRFEEAGRFATAHRFWVDLGFFSFLALTTAGVIARSELRREATLRAEASRLEAGRIGADRWVSDFRPAAAPESLLWERSRHSLAALDGRNENALSVARLVAQRAEQVGITDIELRLERRDSTRSPAPRRVGPWSISSGSDAITVEFAGDLSSIASFLGALPARVEIERLRIWRDDTSALRASVILFIRSVESHA